MYTMWLSYIFFIALVNTLSLFIHFGLVYFEQIWYIHVAKSHDWCRTN